MAEKVVSNQISNSKRSRNSNRSTSRPVRVVHISNPNMVKTSASEFRGVVQSLTGQKRSSNSTNRREDINLYSDNHYGPQVPKVPKLGDELQRLNAGKTSESAFTVDNAAVSINCWSDKDLGDVGIFEELEAQPIQIPDYISSKYQFFEALESIGDSTLDKFCPSILFSEFDSL